MYRPRTTFIKRRKWFKKYIAGWCKWLTRKAHNLETSNASENSTFSPATENEFNHLVSVVRRERFNPNALREVNELRRKARKQDRFSL